MDSIEEGIFGAPAPNVYAGARQPCQHPDNPQFTERKSEETAAGILAFIIARFSEKSTGGGEIHSINILKDLLGALQKHGGTLHQAADHLEG